MIVIDASAVGTALVGEEEPARRVRRILKDERLLAPELLDLEVTSHLRRAVRHEQLNARRALQALDALERLPVERMPHIRLLGRIWALRDNLSTYDAAYVALAEAFGAPLLTADARLARAPGVRCEVRLVG